jgi:hypothetical protein
MLTQKALRDRVAERIRLSRPDCHGRDLSSNEALLSVQQEADADGGTAAVSVIARFDLASWIRGTCAFAMRLPAEHVPAWRRSFTRTIFLAGNPANLADRFAFVHVDEDRSVAWTAPAPSSASYTLRRLLKLFEGAAALPVRSEFVVRLPGARTGSGRRVLYVTTAGMSISDSVVHLNHLLVEAVLDGQLGPGDELLVRQVPRLAGIGERFDALRIGPDPTNVERLRAFGGLTEVCHD